MAIAALTNLATIGAAAGIDEQVNLLRLPSARIEWTTVPGGTRPDLLL
jgi:hypothetical protein